MTKNSFPPGFLTASYSFQAVNNNDSYKNNNNDDSYGKKLQQLYPEHRTIYPPASIPSSPPRYCTLTDSRSHYHSQLFPQPQGWNKRQLGHMVISALSYISAYWLVVTWGAEGKTINHRLAHAGGEVTDRPRPAVPCVIIEWGKREEGPWQYVCNRVGEMRGKPWLNYYLKVEYCTFGYLGTICLCFRGGWREE